MTARGVWCFSPQVAPREALGRAGEMARMFGALKGTGSHGPARKEGRKEGSLGLGQTSSFLTKTPVETPFMSFTVCIHSKTSQMDFQRDVPTLVPLLVGTERGAMFQSDWPQKVPGDFSLSLSPSREYVLSNFLKQNPRVPRVCGSP